MVEADLKSIVDQAWEGRSELTPGSDQNLADTVNQALLLLDSGQERIATKKDQSWAVNTWLKKAVLLKFCWRGKPDRL